MNGFDPYPYKQQEKMADIKLQEEAYRKSKQTYTAPSQTNRWIGNPKTLLFIQLPILLFLLAGIAAFIIFVR